MQIIFPCLMRAKDRPSLTVMFESETVGTIVSGTNPEEIDGQTVFDGPGKKCWHWVIEAFEVIDDCPGCAGSNSRHSEFCPQYFGVSTLKTMMANGTFHHATFRNRGTLWEGLWIYRKFDGLRGFEPAGAFLKDNPELDAAFEAVRGTGVSVGAYGRG